MDDAASDDLNHRQGSVEPRVSNLQATEEHFRTTFKTMGQAYALLELVRDARGRPNNIRLLEFNPAFETLTGISAQTAQGCLLTDVLPSVVPSWVDQLEQVGKTESVERIDGDFLPGRRFRVSFHPAGADHCIALYEDFTESKQAEVAMRESEERQAFLLSLSDVLRPLSAPVAIQQAAMKLLAEKHDVMRAGYLDVHADGDAMTMTARFERDAVPVPPQIRLSDYGSDLVTAFHAGHTLCVRDTTVESETEDQCAAYRAIGVQAWIIAPLVKDGRLIAIVGVVSRTPRDWRPVEIQIVTDVAERTWDAVQRALSDETLRESEQRFQQFASASSAGLWIRDADTLAMEFVSPAIGSMYGIDPDDLLGDVKRWTAMILPEDREAASRHLDAARGGATVIHDFRIKRTSDGAVRWIRNTDFPLRNSGGIVQRIGGIAEDVTESKMAGERQDVLLFELQHRVRNILATLRSIATRTGETSESVEQFALHFEGRVDALARTQSVITQAPDQHVDLELLVREELLAQAAEEHQIAIAGPSVPLAAKTAEVLALVIHELTTNAVKYGALSAASGQVTVRWHIVRRDEIDWLHLTWDESGVRVAAPAPRRIGFGTELIEARVPYELHGSGKLEFRPGGIRCTFELPLHQGRSILQTDDPSAEGPE